MSDFLNWFVQVWQYLQDIPASTWTAFAALLTSGVGVSVVAELVKRRANSKKAKQGLKVAKSFIGLVLAALAGLVTIAQSVIMYGAVNPHFIGQHTPQVLGFAGMIYLWGGSAAYKKTAKFLSNLQTAFSLVSDSKKAVAANNAAVVGQRADVSSTPASSVANDVLQ